MQSDNYNKLAKWIILIVAIVYVVPFVINGHNAYIRLHDNLEGEWIWLKLLADSHTAFNFHPDGIVPEVMKGLPRNVYPTGLSVNMLLVQCFGMYTGYLISSFLIRLIGFIGMTFLLRTYFIKRDENRFIIWLCALTFVVLSVLTPFGLSVMGQPLLLWAFLNLQFRNRRIISYIIIAAFPFYSSIVWFFIPFTALLIIAGLYFHYSSSTRLSKEYKIGLLLLCVTFFIVNFPLFSITFLHQDFISHRLAYNFYFLERPNWLDSVFDVLIMLATTHYHVANFFPVVCLLAILLVIGRSNRLIVALLIAILAIILFQAFYSYPEHLLSAKVDIIRTFRFNRFCILLPFLWLLAFALSLDKMRDSSVFRPLVLPFIAAQLFLAIGGNDEVIHNYRMIAGHQKFPGFENYMAPRQFEKIRDYIGKPENSYYVASFGISPSIAQYNGFYTLDGLMSVYDLRYKEEFRRIFHKELDKDVDIERYYDWWGNRCYIFSSELGMRHNAYNCSKFDQRKVEHFDFDAKAFEALGGKYLISAVEITNHDKTGLHLEAVFDDSQSWWKIYLYSVNQQGV